MGIEQQVYMRSDKAGRRLILTFCIAPVIVPLLAIGAKYALDDKVSVGLAWPQAISSSAQASVSERPPVTFGTLPSRDAFHSVVFEGPTAWAQSFETSDGETRIAQTSRLSPPRSGTHVLREVEARQGLTLASDALVVRLDGVEPVPEGAECRRLDGVVEPCTIRAQNRLDVLTRGRAVTCDLHADEAGDLRGACRAGKIDLADDLLRNGLALRRSE